MAQHESGVSQSGPKYYGLVNQGATCYLNSVLQVLFMTEDFRDRVRSYTRSNADTECIDRELTDLFSDLEKCNAGTYNITNKLKINNVKEQRDAAEHYEKILRLTSPEASQIFHGKLINRSTCKKCNTETESEAGFWHLPLPLVHSDMDYSVEKGLEDFFRPSEISGEDQMYCEQCDEKCDAVLDCEVKHHPEVLVFLLKRFEFDERHMRYVKNRCTVNVPHTLHFPQNHSYELYGSVEHLGEQQFGRYIAMIKSQDDGRWYIFDDSYASVSRYQYFQLDTTEKSQDAYLLLISSLISRRSQTTYLLFYRKVKYHGLLNLGATCYLNSVLQVLFMTEDFRDKVKSHMRDNPETEHIDRELTDLFDDLEKYNVYTFKITNKLKINNVHEQRDAAEHYEKILRLTSPEASEIFHGELINRSTCMTCYKMTESTTGFWHLPLSLVHAMEDYSVNRSLQDFFSRGGQMYCEACDKNCDTALDCEVKHHPEVLVLLLKRFEFDERHMVYVKINRAVEVPYTLILSQNQSYELYACVEHFGELRCGHYLARIRSTHDGRWYIFDDLNVLGSNSYRQLNPTEKSQEAYLLFYRKQKDTVPGDISEVSTAVAPQVEDTSPDNSIRAGQKRAMSSNKKDAEVANKQAKWSDQSALDEISAKHEDKTEKSEERVEHKQELDDSESSQQTHDLDLTSLTHSLKAMNISKCNDCSQPFLNTDHGMVDTKSNDLVQPEAVDHNVLTPEDQFVSEKPAKQSGIFSDQNSTCVDTREDTGALAFDPYDNNCAPVNRNSPAQSLSTMQEHKNGYIKDGEQENNTILGRCYQDGIQCMDGQFVKEDTQGRQAPEGEPMLILEKSALAETKKCFELAKNDNEDGLAVNRCQVTEERYDNIRSDPGLSGVPVNINDSRCIRQLDVDNQSTYVNSDFHASRQDQGRIGSEEAAQMNSMENCRLPEPYRIQYNLSEDQRRVAATKEFIKNEEDMKKHKRVTSEEVNATGSSERTVPLYDLHCAQQNKEISQQEGSRGEGYPEEYRIRSGGIESASVTREGDTEVLRVIPKKKPDHPQLNALYESGDKSRDSVS